MFRIGNKINARDMVEGHTYVAVESSNSWAYIAFEGKYIRNNNFATEDEMWLEMNELAQAQTPRGPAPEYGGGAATDPPTLREIFIYNQNTHGSLVKFDIFATKGRDSRIYDCERCGGIFAGSWISLYNWNFYEAKTDIPFKNAAAYDA